jgi:hypothetical protein
MSLLAVWLTTLGVAVASAVIPVINIEIYLLGAAAFTAGRSPLKSAARSSPVSHGAGVGEGAVAAAGELMWTLQVRRGLADR